MPKIIAKVSRPDRVDTVPVELPDEAFIALAGHPNLVFDVAGASKEAGAGAILWNLHRGDNQRWKIQPATDLAADSTFRIVSAHSGLCLALRDNDRTGPVTQVPIEKGNNCQIWQLYAAEGGHNITNAQLLVGIGLEEAAAGKTLQGAHRNKPWVFTAV
ncbi:RICIN domain-containing protein [Streptomyces klenkii]